MDASHPIMHTAIGNAGVEEGFINWVAKARAKKVANHQGLKIFP